MVTTHKSFVEFILINMITIRQHVNKCTVPFTINPGRTDCIKKLVQNSYNFLGCLLSIGRYIDRTTGISEPYIGCTTQDDTNIFVFTGMLFISLKKGEGSFRTKYLNDPWKLWLAAGALLILVLLFGAYGPGYVASDFIYGQF